MSVGIVIQPTQYYVAAERGVRAFRSANVGQNRVVDRDWVYLSPKGHRANAKSALRAGDVLVVRSGAPGTACVVTEHYAGANCIDIVFARPRRDLVLPEYLAEITNSPIGRRYVLGTQGGLALRHFNVGAYKQLELSLPQLPEQKEIVDLLGAWEVAIQKTEQLVAAKEHQLDILSGRLLWGAIRARNKQTSRMKRLHWFSVPEDWSVPSIGEVASEVSDLNAGAEAIPVLSCTKYDGLVDSLQYFKKQVYSHDTAKYKVVRRGQFAYATNHIEEGSIGYQDFVPAGLVSPIYTVFRTDASRVHDGYLYKVLKTERMRQLFAAATNASVDRRGSLRWKEFARLQVPLPPLDEQRHISEVLDTAREEIALLGRQLDALKLQKRGLMQKLLTGQWRLPVREQEPA